MNTILCGNNPVKGGKPTKKKEALTDQQVAVLLDTVKGLPPYLFIMLGLYSGLRREEILCTAMGLCISGRGYTLSIGEAGMAYRA